MKKVMFFALMVMVSVMVFGTSVAEERLKTDNVIASVAQERQSTEQTSVETDAILLALEGGCSRPVYDLCVSMQVWCCAVSPSNLGEVCGGNFAPGGTCDACGLGC